MAKKDWNYSSVNAFVQEKVEAAGVNCFDVGDYNLVKVIQHGLVDAFYEKQRERTSRYWGLSPKLYATFYGLRNKQTGESPHLDVAPGQILYYDFGPRAIEVGGEQCSVYYHKIAQKEPGIFLTRSKTINASVHRGKIIREHEIKAQFQNQPLDADELHEYALLLRFRKHVFAQPSMRPFKHYIDYWLELFFRQYLYYRRVFRALKAADVRLTGHYHNEGLILAAKQLGMKVTEVQHGLISRSDMYYCYDQWIKPVQPRALIADEIWVFGTYWKQLLVENGHEYRPEQILVKGYYFQESEDPPAYGRQLLEKYGFADKKDIILLATQTGLVNYYCTYVKHLRQLVDHEVPIVVKIHPRNSIEQYDAIADLPNVVISKEDLAAWMCVCSVHMSVYSTTLFDAHRFDGLKNFTLMEDSCREYIEEIIADDIATLIRWDDNPITHPESEAVKNQGTALFAAYEV